MNQLKKKGRKEKKRKETFLTKKQPEESQQDWEQV